MAFTADEVYALLNKKIKSGGGTGGGGVSDWNDLENRPFYSEIVEVFPEKQLEYSEETNGFMIMEDIPIEIGSTYTVSWNGVDYTCDCKKMVNSEITARVLGNIVMIDGDITNEPFSIMLLQPEVAQQMGFYGQAKDINGGTSAILKITKKEYHEIPVNYLPDTMPYDESVNRHLISFICEATEGEWIENEAIGLTVGNTYEVIWNGNKYECVASNHFVFGVSIGNLYLSGDTSAENTGEPFLIYELNNQSEIRVFDLNGSSQLTMVIYEKGVHTHKLENKFLDISLDTLMETIPVSVSVDDEIGNIKINTHNVVMTNTMKIIEQIKKGIVKIAFSYVKPFTNNEIENANVVLFSYDENRAFGTFVSNGSNTFIMGVTLENSQNMIFLELVPLYTTKNIDSVSEYPNVPITLGSDGKYYSLSVDTNGNVTACKLSNT